MDKKLKNVAGVLVDYFGSKIHSSVQQLEKKVDHYKQLRDLESEFLQFGIKSYELFSNFNEVPAEIDEEFNKLKKNIKDFENS